MLWWLNPRAKRTGGMRLSSEGYEALRKLDLEEFSVDLPEDIEFTNQTFLWLDKYVDCPYYLTHKNIKLFDSSMAVQLILFSGNIQKFGLARAKSVALKQQQNNLKKTD